MKKEKRELVRHFKKLSCNKCGGIAYYMPTHSAVVCQSCDEVPTVNTSEKLPVNYLHPESLKDIDMNKDDKYSLVFKDPTDDPLRSFPGRNDPCSCGSGKKFKKCCLPTFQRVRNEEVAKMFNLKRDAAIVSAANAIRLVNCIREHFEANPEDTEVVTTEVGYKPFTDVKGTLKEVDILSSVQAEQTNEEITADNLVTGV